MSEQNTDSELQKLIFEWLELTKLMVSRIKIDADGRISLTGLEQRGSQTLQKQEKTKRREDIGHAPSACPLPTSDSHSVASVVSDFNEVDFYSFDFHSLRGGESGGITEKQLRRLELDFEPVQVVLELTRMQDWILKQPERRRPKPGGLLQFCRNWLTRSLRDMASKNQSHPMVGHRRSGFERRESARPMNNAQKLMWEAKQEMEKEYGYGITNGKEINSVTDLLSMADNLRRDSEDVGGKPK